MGKRSSVIKIRNIKSYPPGELTERVNYNAKSRLRQAKSVPPLPRGKALEKTFFALNVNLMTSEKVSCLLKSGKLVVKIERGKISFEVAENIFFTKRGKIMKRVLFQRERENAFLRGGERVDNGGENAR